MSREANAIYRLGRTLFIVAAMVIGLLLLVLIPTTARSYEMQQSIPQGWQDILRETFDAGIGAGWIVSDTSTTDGGEYTWGTTTFTYTSPITAVWAVGGGADGSSLNAAMHTYPNNVDSWLIYGPLDLSQVFRADLTFDWWLDSAPGDWFGWCMTTDLSNLAEDCDGARISGRIGTWISGTLSLDAYARSSTPVYFAFHFTSNDDGKAGKGAFVDNVVVRGDYGYPVFLPLIRRDATPTPAAYMDDFSGPTTWSVVEHTGDDGPPGTDWFRVHNESGYLKVWVNDRWEHVIASPSQESPSPPFEINAKVYFYQRSWSSGYAFVFGSQDKNFKGSYYRINVVYISEGAMKFQVKRCHGSGGPERILQDYTDVPLYMLNGKDWNTWRIVRDGDRILVYVNNYLISAVTDNAISGKGYFGVMLSTWEFKPIEVWLDYYNIVPRH